MSHSLTDLLASLDESVKINAQAYTTAAADLEEICASAVDEFHLLTEMYYCDNIDLAVVANTLRYDLRDATKWTHPDTSNVRIVKIISLTLDGDPLPSQVGSYGNTSPRYLQGYSKRYLQADPGKPRFYYLESPHTLVLTPEPDDAYDTSVEAVYMPKRLSSTGTVFTDVMIPDEYYLEAVKIATCKLMEFRASGSSMEKLQRLRTELYGPQWYSEGVLAGRLGEIKAKFAGMRTAPFVVGAGAPSRRRYLGGSRGRW